MPSNTNDQEGVLFINGDDTGVGLVTNSAISFPGGKQPVSAHFTCAMTYTNSIPYFDLFIQKDTAFTLKYELNNPSGLDDAKVRTIEFQEAKILDYLEIYDTAHQTADQNDLLVVFTIAATSVSMGESNFPGGS
jgi:hypothetical protein